MSFRVAVMLAAIIGVTVGEVLFWATGDIIYLIAALIILFTNIPNIVHYIRSI